MSRFFDILHARSIEKANAWKKGFNKWDEQWDNGDINASTGENASGSYFRSKNYIPVIPGKDYYFQCPNYAYFFYYDANKTYIGHSPAPIDPAEHKAFTPANNTRYMRFVVASAYGSTYKNDICVNISSEHNGEYVPYNGE